VSGQNGFAGETAGIRDDKEAETVKAGSGLYCRSVFCSVFFFGVYQR